MTREEAIKWFKESLFYNSEHEPVNMAIEALRVEPCEDTISRKAAIDAFNTNINELVVAGKENADSVERYLNRVIDRIKQLPFAQPDNQTNLCDSCDYSYPDCPSKNNDVIYGNGKGNDNICACNKYEPSAQPEIIRCKDCKHYQFADNKAFGMPVKMCEWFGFEDVDDDDFCSRAERKEE